MLWAGWNSWRNEQGRTCSLQLPGWILYPIPALPLRHPHCTLGSLLIPQLNVCSWVAAVLPSFLDPFHLVLGLTSPFLEGIPAPPWGWPVTPHWVPCPGFWERSREEPHRQKLLWFQEFLSLFAFCCPVGFKKRAGCPLLGYWFSLLSLQSFSATESWDLLGSVGFLFSFFSVFKWRMHLFHSTAME